MKGREIQADSYVHNYVTCTFWQYHFFPNLQILYTHTKMCPLLYVLPTHVQDAFGKHVNNPPLTKLPVSYRM